MFHIGHHSFILKNIQNDYQITSLHLKVTNFHFTSAAEELKIGSGVTFSEFLQFIVDEGRYGLISKDWMSIHDMCHPCLVKYNYIAKSETINTDSQFLLDRIFTYGEFPDRRTDLKSGSIIDSNSTVVFDRYYSSVPSQILDGIRKLYALDFEMFGYDENKV